MSYALTGTISARARLEFHEKIDVTDGSFYMTAIEQEQVIMAASSSIEEVKKVFAASRKPIISGTFWEEYLEFNYHDHLAFDNTLAIAVSGTFAFEVDNGETLQRYGVEGGPIATLLIAWAEDGDSPKKIPVPLDVDGELSDCNEGSEFEEFNG